MSHFKEELGTATHIRFLKLPLAFVKSYRVYCRTKDTHYASGWKETLLEEIENTELPNKKPCVLQAEYNQELTWTLPETMYQDEFFLRYGGVTLDTMVYDYNRVTRKVTINALMITIDPTLPIEIVYMQDVIERTYTLQEGEILTVIPVYQDGLLYGTHNIIV